MCFFYAKCLPSLKFLRGLDDSVLNSSSFYPYRMLVRKEFSSFASVVSIGDRAVPSSKEVVVIPCGRGERLMLVGLWAGEYS